MFTKRSTSIEQNPFKNWELLIYLTQSSQNPQPAPYKLTSLISTLTFCLHNSILILSYHIRHVLKLFLPGRFLSEMHFHFFHACYTTCQSHPHYLLTPWCRVLLEKLTGSEASQEIPRIFGTRRFLTVPTSARHLSLS